MHAPLCVCVFLCVCVCVCVCDPRRHNPVTPGCTHTQFQGTQPCVRTLQRRHSFACNVYAQLCQQRTRVCIPVCSQAQLCLQRICTASPATYSCVHPCMFTGTALPATYSCVHPCMFTGTALLATYMHSFARNVLVCASLYVHRHGFVYLACEKKEGKGSYASLIHEHLGHAFTPVGAARSSGKQIHGCRSVAAWKIVFYANQYLGHALKAGGCKEKLWQMNSWLPVDGGIENFLRKPVPKPCIQGR